MATIPSVQSLRLLLSWSEAVEAKRGWVQLTPNQVPETAGMHPRELEQCVSELTARGYCTPAAHGDLIYLTREGAKMARTVRDLLAQDTEGLGLETLVAKLFQFQVPIIKRHFAGAFE